MTKLENVVPIIFPPGYFGHYLYWVLDNFTEIGDNESPTLPFRSDGSSHNVKSHGCIYKHFKDLIKQDTYRKFEIMHQCVTIDENSATFNDVFLLSDSVKKCIVINQTKDFFLAEFNLIYEKSKGHIDPIRIINRAVINNTNWNDDPKYVLREFLSYKLFHTIQYSNSNNYHNDTFPIEVNDILYHFEDTLKRLVNWLDTSITTPMSTILENHNTMLSLQKHISKDKDIAHFLECFENKINCIMPNDSTIIDEAYIQKYLRDKLSLEIKCFELDIFPKTTTELHKITYPAEELKRLE